MNLSSAGATVLFNFGASLSGGWAGNTDAQVLAAANAATIANPTPQGQVIPPFPPTSVMPLVSSASWAKILLLPSFDSTVLPLLNAVVQTSATVQDLYFWAVAYLSAGAITQSEFNALAAIPGSSPTAPATTNTAGLFWTTVPDPSWQSELSWAEINLGRQVDLSDVATARAV